MTHVKICCIQSIAEAQLAIKNGAYAIGLVSNMPSGPGVIKESTIRDIAKWAPKKVKTVLLTSFQSANELIEQHKYCGTDVIQLVDSQDIETYSILRQEFPDLELMQVIHVIDEESITKAIEISKFINFILLDSGNPNLSTKELGGTGRTHNWDLSKQIIISVNVPVFLAGGLNHENVSEAIDIVNSFGVDLCTGVRSNGNLDEDKVKLFFKAVIK